MQSKPVVPTAVQQLFAPLPAPARSLTLSARDLLLAALPEAIEIPDPKAKIIGYGFGSGYRDMVATLILSKRGFKIGLVQSASFPDPASLLQGKGKVHRHVIVRTQADLQRPELRQLLDVGLSAWRQRTRARASAS